MSADPASPAKAEEPTAPILTRREKIVAGASVGVGALLTLSILMTRTGASTAMPVARVAPASAVAAPLAEPAAEIPAWTDENRALWVGNARRGVAYEVAADANVSVWMRTVRPSLVVRCAGSGTEVFVFTDSAAQLERDTPDHTVRFKLDDGPETTERWPDPDEHDALFAPDGAAFVRRLTRARTLTFGFAPHNAAPVTVRFHVAGLGPLLQSAAKNCGN
jgi:hypothetical protein